MAVGNVADTVALGALEAVTTRFRGGSRNGSGGVGLAVASVVGGGRRKISAITALDDTGGGAVDGFGATFEGDCGIIE